MLCDHPDNANVYAKYQCSGCGHWFCLDCIGWHEVTCYGVCVTAALTSWTASPVDVTRMTKEPPMDAEKYEPLAERVRGASSLYRAAQLIANALRTQTAEHAAEAKRLREEHERESMQILEERDSAEQALQETHVALGGDGEWAARMPPMAPPDSGDLRVDAPALAAEVVQRADHAEARLREVAGEAYEAGYKCAKDDHGDLTATARADIEIDRIVSHALSLTPEQAEVARLERAFLEAALERKRLGRLVQKVCDDPDKSGQEWADLGAREYDAAVAESEAYDALAEAREAAGL